MTKTGKSKIHFKAKGAIFDIDDTLLDNRSGYPGKGLHERARFTAVREVGERHNIEALKNISVDDNLKGFMTAPVHSLEGAVWNILVMTGVADSQVIDRDNPFLKEIVERKNQLYERILLEEGEEVEGAIEFVHSLANTGIGDNFAIASSAIRRDVDVFLNKTGLSAIFAENKIKTIENITHPKPNPEIFNLVFESFELSDNDREFVCVFEDDPRGIMAARAAGFFVCAIGTRYIPEQLLALEVPPHVAYKTYAEYMQWFGFA